MARKARLACSQPITKPTAPRAPPEFPFNLAAIRSLERLVQHPQVSFLAGENGFYVLDEPEAPCRRSVSWPWGSLVAKNRR